MCAKKSWCKKKSKRARDVLRVRLRRSARRRMRATGDYEREKTKRGEKINKSREIIQIWDNIKRGWEKNTDKMEEKFKNNEGS